MALPSWLIPAGLGALGFLGGSQKNKTTQTTTNTLDPAYSGLQNALIQQAMSRLNQPQAMSQSQIASGVGKINDTYQIIGQGIGNRAAAQGVSGGAGEMYAMNNLDQARGGDIGQYRAVTVPGIERDWRNQDLASALGVLGTGRYGSQTTQSGGGGLGGGLSGLGGMLGFMYGSGGSGLGGGTSGGSTSPSGGTGTIDWSKLFANYGVNW